MKRIYNKNLLHELENELENLIDDLDMKISVIRIRLMNLYGSDRLTCYTCKKVIMILQDSKWTEEDGLIICEKCMVCDYFFCLNYRI
jgi:hypothetical protein